MNFFSLKIQESVGHGILFFYIFSGGLELIASKWAHSLTEFDLAWANVQTPLDNAIRAIAEKGSESPLQ